jgi:tungstate transport system permease protein
MVVGGGIEGLTNVMTTAIALEVLLGNYEYALALGGILVVLTVGLSIVARAIGGLVWR